MADLAFDLEYDGDALATHEMDVRDLAPALLSTSLLFQELGRQVYPGEPPLTVNVRATAEGSFLVQLKLVYDDAVGVLKSDDATAIANLTAILGVAGWLIHLIRKRFSSHEVKQEAIPDDPGSIRVTFEDGTVIEVPASVLRLVDNLSIRQNLGEVVKPLTQPGVDVVRFSRNEITIAEVRKEEAAAFERPPGPPEREVLFAGQRDTYLTIHTAGFQTNRWRFSDGSSLLWATISDETFTEELATGHRRVGPLDVLHCRIDEQQWRDPSGFHRQVEVARVLDVLPYEPGEQGTLDLGVPTSDASGPPEIEPPR